MFGRGRGAHLLVAGRGRNPDHCDLMAELYATLDPGRTYDLLHDPETGLAETRIGQGCSSLTMPMTDARVSAMAAGLTEEAWAALDANREDGRIVVAVSDGDGPSTTWTRTDVAAFDVVPVSGGDWTVRVSPRVTALMRAEAARHPTVETGGVLVGAVSARLRTVTVVDLIDPPADSSRSAHLFMLGVRGLADAIAARHERSGRTLFDVGTWHTHLSDTGPSPTDRRTAAELAAERAPPSILLIVTPRRMHAIMGDASVTGGAVVGKVADPSGGLANRRPRRPWRNDRRGRRSGRWS